MTDSKVILHDVFYDTSNFLCIYPLLYTAGMCDVTFIGVYNTYLHNRCFLPTLYNDMICYTLYLVTHAQTHMLLRSSLCRPMSHFLHKCSVLHLCFYSQNTRNHRCFSLEGQCCECFTSIWRCWDAFGLGLPLEVPLAVTFSSREWIINSQTRISGKFLCVILPPHDLCIRNAFRMVMSVRQRNSF
jgi:hypothetical protein